MRKSPFDENLVKLKAYQKMHGTFHVPREWKKDLPFSRWVEAIRRHPERIAPEQYKKLKKIGFDFSFVTGWEDMFQRLEAFHAQHGHAYVPAHQKAWESLFDWAMNQRNSRALLKPQQVRKLDSLNFDWEVSTSDDDIRWKMQYAALIQFKQRHGHTRVPQHYKDNPKLATWVAHQRRKEDSMSRYRLRLLKEIGFTWKRDVLAQREQVWEKRLEQLVHYKKKHGHMDRLLVKRFNFQLGLWVETQIVRKKYLTAARKKKLDAIGFNFDKGDYSEDRWNEMFARYKAYIKQHKTNRVKRSADPKLAVWVQRMKRDKAKLPADKRKKLEQIGIQWSYELFNKLWHTQYNELKAFKKEHGHLGVVRKKQPILYEWIQGQKALKTEKRLPREREILLNKLGFIWKGEVEKEKTDLWNTRYEAFKAFQKRVGPRYIVEIHKHATIYRWAMRQLHNQYKLPAAKIEKLDAINFAWNWRRQHVNALWNDRFQELVAYKKKFGHCDVMQGDKQYASLGRWVNGQRSKKLSTEHKNRLTALGFSWAGEIKENRWQQRVDEYLKLKKNGKVDTVRAHMPLHSWIYQQNKNFKKLPKNKKQILLKAGIVKTR